MRRRTLLAVPLLLVVSSSAAFAHFSYQSVGPFVSDNVLGTTSAGTAVGDGPWTPTGLHLACVAGRRYALSMALRNRSDSAVTLTWASVDPPSARIVRRVAVQFRLAPPDPKGDIVVSGLRPWSRSAPTAVIVGAGRTVWVQENFVMQNCGLLASDQALIANRSITLTYRANGHTGSQQLGIPGLRLIVTP
jgi:hypothetical protein